MDAGVAGLAVSCLMPCCFFFGFGFALMTCMPCVRLMNVEDVMGYSNGPNDDAHIMAGCC